MNRRTALKSTFALGASVVAQNLLRAVPSVFTVATSPKIRSAKDAHEFFFFGDTLGYDGGPAPEFSRLNAMIRARARSPEFVLVAGDHIWDAPDRPEVMRTRWAEWTAAFAPLAELPSYHLTGNHTVYDPVSAELYREKFPSLPQNGPAGQEGLSWFVRRGNLLLIGVNTAFNPLGKVGRVECTWLDEVLQAHRDATIKIVAGHHPVHPVNGFHHYHWRVTEPDGKRFWAVLARHQVRAYLCAHVIAFDAQVHDGVLQICSACGGFPFFGWGDAEYHHACRVRVTDDLLACETLDPEGKVREWLSWPPAPLASEAWQAVSIDGKGLPRKPDWFAADVQRAQVLALRFRGELLQIEGERQTLLGGSSGFATPGDAIWIGIEGGRIGVSLANKKGGNPHLWRGPELSVGRFDFQLALHTGMGPGGVLYRASDKGPWSSLAHDTSRGLEHWPWPEQWSLGCDYAGRTSVGLVDSLLPFRGTDLEISAHWKPLEYQSAFSGQAD